MFFIVDEHPIIYWNLLWYYERVAVKSHLPALCISAKSLNEKVKTKLDDSWAVADERNVHICCKWDNQRLYEESGCQPPIYTCWRVTEPTENKEISEAFLKKILDDQTHEALKPHMQMIIAGVQNNDLLKVRDIMILPNSDITSLRNYGNSYHFTILFNF